LEVNDEVMASLRPELVLLATHGDPEEIRKAFLRKTAEGGPWRGMSNVRQGIHVLDPALFATNPGLRMVEAARRLTGFAGR
ncbi:MAG TPA: hypothetical protein VEL74_15585, partial [Thermoanaerobaculia bacterium]|nr:hypothetical protein [Thermoanaerobaculia bacterium]